MSQDTSILWPGCLGTFDEESCRYFLHEVGKRVVPIYPFSFGMEEVYGLILEKYGYEGTSDVTSLLQELLEDDQNATGLGDDGDVWRSWRHGWRHRNDDARNPFIPRYGALVLQQSTTPRIRLLKANNFIQLYEQLALQPRVESAEDTPGLGEPASRELRNKYNAKLAVRDTFAKNGDIIVFNAAGERRPSSIAECSRPRSCTASIAESPIPIQHLRRSSAVALDASLSLPRGLLSCTRHGMAQLRGGNASKTVDPKDKPCLVTIAADVGGQSEHCKTPGDLFPAEVARLKKIPALFSRDSIDQICCGPSSASEVMRNGESCGLYRKYSEDGPESERDISVNVFPIVVPATGSAYSDEQKLPSPQHATIRRAVHRQARLINGTIFTSKSRKAKTLSQAPIMVPDSLDPSNRRTTAYQSWSSTEAQDNTGENSAYGIGQLLHHCEGQDKNKQTTLKYRSTPGLCRRSRPRTFTNISMATDQCQQTTLNPTQPLRNTFGLDGTSDIVQGVCPTVDLNKPLPLNPEEIVKSMSCRSQKTTSQYSDDTTNLPSTSSTISSASRSLNRSDFRDLTSSLVQSSMTTSHELPPIHEVETNSQHFVDPPKSPAPPPPSPASYSNLARGNPFIKNPLRSPPKPSPLDFSCLQKEKGTAYRSDYDKSPDAHFLAATRSRKQGENYVPVSLWSNSDYDGQHGEGVPGARGRSKVCPDALKYAKGENSLLETPVIKDSLPPKTPTKRSRSPIKRFLALTKSSTTNKLDEASTPARPKTPGVATKESLKKWGDRFRYGFLTPDQEQLRQEELIEAHNNDSTTSTPQNSTFPISLDPPMQAKVQSEIELIMTVTANRYLLHESRAGRISPESVAKIKDQWQKMNRPQVIEFHFDQLTQHNIVMANLDRVKLYGDASKDPIAINSTMRGWKTMATEMSIRTFCSPDSVMRKHLHDAHRVLELLGAPLVTFLAYEDMQLKTLTNINQRQKERNVRRGGSADRNISSSSATSAMFSMARHRRNASEGSYDHGQEHDYTDYPITSLQMDKIRLSPSPTPREGAKVRKATGADGAIMSLPSNFDRSRSDYPSRLRSAKLGYSIKEI